MRGGWAAYPGERDRANDFPVIPGRPATRTPLRYHVRHACCIAAVDDPASGGRAIAPTNETHSSEDGSGQPGACELLNRVRDAEAALLDRARALAQAIAERVRRLLGEGGDRYDKPSE
jgi:hypothetical protein